MSKELYLLFVVACLVVVNRSVQGQELFTKKLKNNEKVTIFTSDKETFVHSKKTFRTECCQKLYGVYDSDDLYGRPGLLLFFFEDAFDNHMDYLTDTNAVFIIAKISDNRIIGYAGYTIDQIDEKIIPEHVAFDPAYQKLGLMKLLKEGFVRSLYNTRNLMKTTTVMCCPATGKPNNG